MQMETANEPIVQLTPGAAEEVKSLLGKPENNGKVLRVYVEKGGCSGMQYSMVFDEKRADDFAGEMHGVSVLVDRSGGTVDLGYRLEALLTVAAESFAPENTTPSAFPHRSRTRWARSMGIHTPLAHPARARPETPGTDLPRTDSG